MDAAMLGQTLYALLAAGAGLAATTAAGELGKVAVKDAYSSLKDWLTAKHDAGSLDLIDQAEAKPA